jgi:seryl-tRNA synthetase
MHDIKIIRENPAAYDAALAQRGIAPLAAALIGLDDGRKKAVADLQTFQAERNQIAKQIGEAKRAKQDSAALEARGAALRSEMEALQAEVPKLEAALNTRLADIPNSLDATVPEGRDETANVEVSAIGPLRNFAFTPKQHFELGEALGQMDFANAAKLAGSRFTILRGALARLERALGQFMLDTHVTEHGYTETTVPYLVNDATMFGTGQLPKFAEDLFKTVDGRWLIPTAEVPLTNIVAGEILAHDALPIRLTALTPSFRLEAGSAGRDVRGMLRQHQFMKVELVSITRAEDSEAEHERMTRCAEVILEKLQLPYRKMLLCAGDTGFAAAKTYDLEVFLPGQGMYREISSCSNTRAFQARRMNARYRDREGKTIHHVHTLNGSGVAVGRALIAVLENYQNADGSIAIPEILRPYMGGADIIAAT